MTGKTSRKAIKKSQSYLSPLVNETLTPLVVSRLYGRPWCICGWKRDVVRRGFRGADGCPRSIHCQSVSVVPRWWVWVMYRRPRIIPGWVQVFPGGVPIIDSVGVIAGWHPWIWRWTQVVHRRFPRLLRIAGRRSRWHRRSNGWGIRWPRGWVLRRWGRIIRTVWWCRGRGWAVGGCGWSVSGRRH